MWVILSEEDSSYRIALDRNKIHFYQLIRRTTVFEIGDYGYLEKQYPCIYFNHNKSYNADDITIANL